jgi:hypothetical protein
MPWKSKFNVSPPDQRRSFGRTYASKAEKEYADWCRACHSSGAFQLVLEQVSIWLGVPENTYRPDFFIIFADGSYEFVDVKGVETAAFKKTVRLWKAYGPCRLRVVKRKGKGFATAYVVEKGAQCRAE